MLFTEPTFLFLFLPVLLGLCFAPHVGSAGAFARPHALPRVPRVHRRYANWLLLVASILFYAKSGRSFTWLMLGSIAFNYWMAIAIAKTRFKTDQVRLKPDPTTPAAPHPTQPPAPPHSTRVVQVFRPARTLLAFTVAVNLTVLGIFKYANFFADNVNALFLALHVRPVVVPRVLLPIGISFFTFHAISYVVDVYRGDATAQKSPVHAALYLLLFPQLIAGPIIRYRDIADQLAERIVTLDGFALGVRRFIIGLAKKVMIANVVAGPADQIFALPASQLDPGHAWLGVICYTLQIYFDFSGYSDMAIGLGRMFGFRFPENFRWPYIAESVQGFWRRWHMSLSTWFRDYLYVPLGGNRATPSRVYGNLVTVFFLCGLWHGASWNFVIWGLYHGAFLVIERLGLADVLKRLWTPLRHGYLWLVVMVGWVFFRADSAPAAFAVLRAMAGARGNAPGVYTVGWYLTPELWLALAAGLVGSMPIVPTFASWHDRITSAGERRVTAAAFAPLSTIALTLLLAASMMQIAARTYNPFIYFRF